MRKPPESNPQKHGIAGYCSEVRERDIAGGHQDYPRQHQKVTDHTPLEWRLPDHEKSGLAFAQHNQSETDGSCQTEGAFIGSL